MFSGRQGLTLLRQHAVSIFDTAIKAVHAETAIKRHCRAHTYQLEIDNYSFDLREYQKIYVIGAGKASAYMGKAIEDLILPFISDGTIIVKYGHCVPLKKIRLFEAGHPVPDSNGVEGARRIIELCDQAEKNDLIICLVSGGGSALLPLPAESLTLSDKQETIKALLACGSSIDEINTLRKHMSAIKGGRLAQRAYPARIVTLILSDVIGDRLDIIASGPTVGDPGTFKDCMNIISKYRLKDQIPIHVLNHISEGISGNIKETPKPNDPVFAVTTNLLIGNNMDALSAAKLKAESLGYQTMILSSMIDGNTHDAALFHCAIAKEIRRNSHPIPPPACILSGGETTMVVTGNGMGGRNQEFALSAAINIQDESDIVMLCAGTDGTDGPTDAAGAVIDPSTYHNAIKMGADPQTFLKNNDSYHFFQKTGDILITGPTGTNVMDLRIIVVG